MGTIPAPWQLYPVPTRAAAWGWGAHPHSHASISGQHVGSLSGLNCWKEELAGGKEAGAMGLSVMCLSGLLVSDWRPQLTLACPSTAIGPSAMCPWPGTPRMSLRIHIWPWTSHGVHALFPKTHLATQVSVGPRTFRAAPNTCHPQWPFGGLSTVTWAWLCVSPSLGCPEGLHVHSTALCAGFETLLGCTPQDPSQEVRGAIFDPHFALRV